MQRIFNPLDHGFRWTNPGTRDEWYEFDHATAHAAAKAARDAAFREAKTAGLKCRRSSLGTQLVSRGGIGSGHPHIELHVRPFVLDCEDER